MSRTATRLLLAAISVGTLVLANPAFAQSANTPAADSDAGNDSIIVTGSRIVSTATKTEIPLLETPQSISVVSRESLELRNVQRIKEALRFTAGVQVDKYGGDTRYDQIELRGFSATIFGEYRDSLRQVSNGALFFRNESYGLQALEVLKGPSSVLFGQNAPGGLVNLVSKRPTDGPIAELQADIGNFHRYQIKGDLGGALNSDETVFARVTVLGRDGRADLSGQSRDDRVYIAPAITFRPWSRTELTLYMQYLKNESVGQPFTYTDLAGNATHVRTYDPSYDRLSQQQLLAGWSFTQELGDIFKFRQNARYGEIDVVHLLTGASGAAPGTTVVPRIAFGTRAGLDSYSIDNQLSAEFDAGPVSINLLAGYDYNKTSSLTDLEFGFGTAQGIPDLDILNPTYGTVAIPRPPRIALTDRTDKQGGFYGQMQMKVAGWIATGGVRRDKVSSHIVDKLYGGRTDSDDSATTYRVGLTKLFDFGLAPFVSYSTSFQIVPGADFAGNPFVPSKGKQIEGGIKFQPKGIRGLFTASVFRLTQDNVLTIDPANAGLGFSVQTGHIRSEGIELEASVEPIRNLSTGAAFTYDKVKVTESNGIDQGMTPPATPRIITSGYANYNITDGALAGVGIGGAVRYIGKSYADQVELVRNKAATYFDGFLSYQLGHIRLGLNVDNIFDKQNPTCNFGFCYFVQGRSILGSVRYRF